MMKLNKKELKELIQTKLHAAGLTAEHASDVADVLVFADAKGVHSHGAIRVEYYAERIAKGGININPEFSFKKSSGSTGMFFGDNGPGHVAAKKSMEIACNIAKENGVAVIGVKKISHSGALSYYVQQAAKKNLIGISVCQADPMAVPYGGAEPYYGTNPIAFAAPGEDGKMIVFDMATTEKAWGKVLESRAKNEEIPDSWAVDKEGNPTTNPFNVSGLLPISGSKGYGLAMMVDILSGILLGLPFGNRVSALYGNLSEGRNLGQLHIVIDPAFFTSLEDFKQRITCTMNDLNNMKTAPGFEQVFYPGQRSLMKEKTSEKEGIHIDNDVYEYLISDVVHTNKYSEQNSFGN